MFEQNKFILHINMADNIIKGDKLMIFVGGSAIAYATSHTLSLTGNTTDISSKDHGFWGASDIGNLTWEATTENLYTEAGFDGLFNAYLKKTPVTIVFGYASNYNVNGLWLGEGTNPGGYENSWTADSTKGYTGQAVITSLSVNANTGENATFSCTFTGKGAIRNLNTSNSDNGGATT